MTTIALTVAGSDPSGAAGVQVDLQVFRDFGLHGTSALTAVLWQDTTTVHGWHLVPPAVLAHQVTHLLADLSIAAVKLGILPTPQAVLALSDVLPKAPLVLDPVLHSGDGSFCLASPGVLEAIHQSGLFARTDVLTPNLPELQQILGEQVTHRDQMLQAALECRGRTGARAVFLKAGHMVPQGADTIQDAWADAQGARWLSPLPRLLEVGDVRGTGCQLSSAIAASLAKGAGALDAAEAARRYLHRLLAGQVRWIGRGRGVVVRAGKA